MKILLIDNGTKHLGRLKDLLVGNEIDVYELISKYPTLINYDLVILSGGSQISITSAPEIFEQEIELIKNSNVPIIGICQGCEIIAYAFGSKLERKDYKINGIKNIEFVSNILGLPKLIQVYEAHHFAIKELGRELVSLAKSNDGIEVFRHEHKPMYGLQFHPEMAVNITEGDDFFKMVLSLI